MSLVRLYDSLRYTLDGFDTIAVFRHLLGASMDFLSVDLKQIKSLGMTSISGSIHLDESERARLLTLIRDLETRQCVPRRKERVAPELSCAKVTARYFDMPEMDGNIKCQSL